MKGSDLKIPVSGSSAAHPESSRHEFHGIEQDFGGFYKCRCKQIDFILQTRQSWAGASVIYAVRGGSCCAGLALSHLLCSLCSPAGAFYPNFSPPELPVLPVLPAVPVSDEFLSHPSCIWGVTRGMCAHPCEFQQLHSCRISQDNVGTGPWGHPRALRAGLCLCCFGSPGSAVVQQQHLPV